MTTASSFDRGPFLSAMLICEKVLREVDGVNSAIRIVDRVTHTVAGPTPPEQMAPFDYEMALLIRLKCGEARGLFQLELRMIKPSGATTVPFKQNILLEGEEDRGADIVINAQIRFEETGIYWFEAVLSGVRLTRVPFRVNYMPQFMQIGGQSGTPGPGREPQLGP